MHGAMSFLDISSSTPSFSFQKCTSVNRPTSISLTIPKLGPTPGLSSPLNLSCFSYTSSFTLYKCFLELPGGHSLARNAQVTLFCKIFGLFGTFFFFFFFFEARFFLELEPELDFFETIFFFCCATGVRTGVRFLGERRKLRTYTKNAQSLVYFSFIFLLAGVHTVGVHTRPHIQKTKYRSI